ncbi:hypothetical protein DUI87_31170 [Hirundo rustica rustica]|uniref:Uncharacterized protein n=1 Tax=Hirundo rustica rustica TaxID=333673 RepID=A0A3M0IWW1_HIRRU|nr:hypothetical protein DUI87_31170 [Hirundo rustica rustica]
MEEPPLQQPLPPGEDEEEGEEEEETDAEWSFVDREMEAVALRDLPTATIACNLDPRVFQDGPYRTIFSPISMMVLLGKVTSSLNDSVTITIICAFLQINERSSKFSGSLALGPHPIQLGASIAWLMETLIKGLNFPEAPG